MNSKDRTQKLKFIDILIFWLRNPLPNCGDDFGAASGAAEEKKKQLDEALFAVSRASEECDPWFGANFVIIPSPNEIRKR